MQKYPTYGPRATIRPARRFYPARKVSQKCQKWQFCVYQVSFFKLQNTPILVFCRGSAPGPAGGAYDAPPDPLVGIPFPLDLAPD